MSAFAPARNSVTPCNCWPLSMFQSTIRSDFGGRNDPPVWRKVTGNDVVHFHIYTVAVTVSGGHAFARFALTERAGALQRCRPGRSESKVRIKSDDPNDVRTHCRANQEPVHDAAKEQKTG